MAGINHLRDVHQKKGDEFLNNLLNNYVIISEKVEGTFFGVKKNKDDSLRYFKKSGEISYVDKVLMKYYNTAITYFDSIPLAKRQRIPQNFYFGFEYFTRGDGRGSRYKRLPKNNLVLSHIHKLDDKGNIESTVQNRELLDRWANYLDVEKPPIVFEGHLDDEQKTAILDFVHTPEKELTSKFKTTSFTKHIISVLNDKMPASFLMDDLEGSIETIVFRFFDEKADNPKAEVFLAKIVDPMFQEREESAPPKKENKSQDYIWLIVIDLMNHFETYDIADLKKHIDPDLSFDQNYLELLDSIFKDFIAEYAQKYEGLVLEVPEYLKRPEFELDSSLVRDPEVVKLITNNETYREVYKILINFFRKTRKRTSSGFFTPGLLTQLNIIVAKIRNIIMGDAVYESLFPSFNEFVGIETTGYVLSETEHAKEVYDRRPQVKVNLLIGSFQPVTIGHIKAAEKLKKANGHPVVFVAVKPDSQTAKSPFSLKLTRILLEKVQQEYRDLIHAVKIIPSGQIEDVIESIQPDCIPMLWGTSDKRIKDHALQLDYIKKKKVHLRLSSDFKMVELPSFTTSEEVLSLIKDSDFLEFKKKVPTSVASEFFNLQKELSANESNKGFKGLAGKMTINAEIIDQKLNESL